MSSFPLPLLVVTPTLGRSPWLPQTVATVAEVGRSCLHVLVAPAGLVPDLAAQFPRTRVVAEPDPGAGMYAAINAGIAAAPDWAAFTYINDDDFLLPRFAAVAREAEAAGDRPLLVYGRVRLVDAMGRRLGAIPVSPWPRLNRTLYAQRLEPVFQQGTLVTRAAWRRVGGFDEALRFCGDSKFLARACVAGVPAVRIWGEVAAFRLRPGQFTQDRAAMVAERSRVDAQLSLVATRPSWRHRLARLIFRTANLAVYAERLFRHGWISFDDLLVRAGNGPSQPADHR
jgi:hypothetical protein